MPAVELQKRRGVDGPDANIAETVYSEIRIGSWNGPIADLKSIVIDSIPVIYSGQPKVSLSASVSCQKHTWISSRSA